MMGDARSTTRRWLRGRQSFTSRASLAVLALGLVTSSGFSAAPVDAAGTSPAAPAGATAQDNASASQDAPTIQYEEAVTHASESFSFTPGDAVTVPYTPRQGDPVVIDGRAPTALPSGQSSGRAIAATPKGTVIPAADAVPVLPAPTARASTLASPNGKVNLLRREIYGFLPYWELGTPLNYDLLSTVAYFGVDLNSDGSLDQSGNGWSGWTSSKLTTVINDAHANGVRVVMTVESFAWTTPGANAQYTMLNSLPYRQAAVANIVAQVVARGVDGVNLDFEPISGGTLGTATQASNRFVNFVQELRTALDAVHPGYEIVFCATGHIGNYDAANLLAPGAADAVFIMGYDFRTGSPALTGSIDPLRSPTIFDLTDSVNEYMAEAPVSKIILGLPYYGRAWSTGTNQSVNAPPGDIPTYGGPASVYYSTAAAMANTWGWRYDSIESTAWTMYYGNPGDYGPQATWRQLYFDSAQSLTAKDDMINYWNLRGSGIWALGEDGNAPELNAVIAAEFLTDKTPPKTGIVDLASLQSNEGFAVSWTGRDDWNGVANYDVQVSTDGGPFATWLTATTLTTADYQGQTGHNYSFRVRGTDGVGNVGAWNISDVYTASPAFAVGGFGTVVAGSASERSTPTVSAAAIVTAATGTVLQIIGGPVSADGFTWYQVTGPITEWNAVQPLFPGLWVAATDGTHVFLAPSTPPNSTSVSAGITGLGVGTPGVQPSGTGIDRGKVFSPDGDGIHDTISMTWTDNAAMSDVTVNVYRADGSVVGSIDLGAQAAGPQSFAWNGTVNGSAVLPDGQYMLQVGAISGGSTYYAPSPAPFGAAQMASFGIIIDTTPTGTYYPVPPARIMDTRTGTGPTGQLISGTARKLKVAGQFNVPANAIAVTGNLTIAGASGAGYVTLGSSLAGGTSTINLAARDDRANGVTMGLAADGTLSMIYSGPAKATAQAIFDLTGYFVRDPNGATFFPVTPARIVDTRVASGIKTPLKNRTVATFSVSGLAGVPAGATAVTGNVTVVGPASAGYVVVAPTINPNSPPSTSTINFPAGDTRANNVVVQLSGGQLQAEYVGKAGTAVQFLFDVTGYFVPGLSGATFVPLSPGRLVDSRIKVGFTGPLNTGASASFAASGQVAIHTIAVAVVGNLTIANQTSGGWLGVGPVPSSAVSTVNFPVGDFRANGFVSFIGANGTLTVTFGGTRNSKAQVVLDVLGYYR